MRIEDQLKKEHNELEEKLKKLIDGDSKTPEQKLSLYKEIRQSLIEHAEAEETALYSRLRKEGDDEISEEIDESKQEHHVARLIIRELDNTQVSSPEWIAKVKVLKEVMEHHNREEEREQLKESRQLFSDEEAQRMLKEFKELKKEVEAAA